MSLLNGRIQSADFANVKDCYLQMQRRGLVLPQKRNIWDVKTAEFAKDPQAFMEREFLAMWDKVGTEYLGLRFYLPKIFDILRDRHPELEEGKADVILDPEDGILSEESIEIFYQIFSERKDEYRFGFVREDQLRAEIIEDPDLLDAIGKTTVSELSLAPDEKDLKLQLLEAANIVLGGAVHPGFDSTTARRINEVLWAAESIYDGACLALKENWGDRGVVFNRGDVIRVITELLPQWFSWGKRKATDQPDGVIRKAIGAVRAATEPIINYDGEKVTSPDQLFYWGPAIDIVD